MAFGVLAFLACLVGDRLSVGLVAVGWTYYSLACLGIDRLRVLLADGRVTQGAVLVLLFFAFLVIPGVALPGLSMPAFLIIGWELTLSGYSYCIETSRPGASPPALGDRLFFLLVNPTLVYTARGKPTSDPPGARSLLRVAYGALLMTFAMAVLDPVVDYLRHLSSTPGSASAIFLVGLFGLCRFLALYAVHSGLASVQIGMMRQVGWVVPERYRYPLLATSPLDFWRRWNVYVRVWLEAYVFLPLGRRLARSTRRRVGPLAAVVATLLASGVIHDAFVFAGQQRLSGTRTKLFLAAGALVVGWRLAESVGRAGVDRIDLLRERLPSLGRWCGRVGLGTAVVAAAAVWGR